MFDLLRQFDPLDYALVAVISLIAGMFVRRWGTIAWIVFCALLADFSLPLIYYLVSGDGWTLAWSRADARYVDSPGGLLIWRMAAYFALISAIFTVKVAWSRR